MGVTYDQIARRWRDRILGIDDRPNYKSSRLIADGDRILSYGTHFEVGRILRDNRGAPRTWLLNGDRFSNTTSKHQAVVLSAINNGMGRDYPRVTIPYSALEAASIFLDSIEVVQVTSDWWEEKTESHSEFPESAEWQYEYENLPGSGGWHHTKTDEWRSANSWERPKDDTPKLGWWRQSQETWDEWHQREEDHDRMYGHWEWVNPQRKNTGRKTVVNKRGWARWEIIDHPDSPTGIFYVRTWTRHWLGESLIKAKVRYWGRRKCRTCQFTGMVEGTTCPDCRGSRWQAQIKDRPAYFLSGFDSNEARPSYYFCELAPGVRPFTVTEAVESLKPASVKLAEQMGRDVQRQGDIFWIPMPELDTKDLKKQGQFTRRKVIETTIRWGGNRLTYAADPYILSTNHTVTEQVTVGRLTYARGILRHEPELRAADHARIRLGDGKTWGLVVKNTVPIGV